MEKRIQSPVPKVSGSRSAMPFASTSRMTSQGLPWTHPGSPSSSWAVATVARDSRAAATTRTGRARMASLPKDGGEGEEGWGAKHPGPQALEGLGRGGLGLGVGFRLGLRLALGLVGLVLGVGILGIHHGVPLGVPGLEAVLQGLQALGHALLVAVDL